MKDLTASITRITNLRNMVKRDKDEDKNSNDNNNEQPTTKPTLSEKEKQRPRFKFVRVLDEFREYDLREIASYPAMVVMPYQVCVSASLSRLCVLLCSVFDHVDLPI
jgi:hypothetical protein